MLALLCCHFCLRDDLFVPSLTSFKFEVNSQVLRGPREVPRGTQYPAAPSSSHAPGATSSLRTSLLRRGTTTVTSAHTHVPLKHINGFLSAFNVQTVSHMFDVPRSPTCVQDCCQRTLHHQMPNIPPEKTVTEVLTTSAQQPSRKNYSAVPHVHTQQS